MRGFTNIVQVLAVLSLSLHGSHGNTCPENHYWDEGMAFCEICTDRICKAGKGECPEYCARLGAMTTTTTSTTTITPEPASQENGKVIIEEKKTYIEKETKIIVQEEPKVGETRDETLQVEQEDQTLLLILCILVTSCLLVIALGLTVYVIYRCILAKNNRMPSQATLDQEKPLVGRPSFSTQYSTSTDASNESRAATSCCFQQQQSQEDGKRSNVYVTNILSSSAGTGNGSGFGVGEKEGGKVAVANIDQKVANMV